ncbi:MAG: F0F1 ATP synthase subunit delta [Dermatophilaceae bacterium]|nr:F0F1 ATP synthase subunit delta [Dermatophilaceae bacterium]
MQGSSRAAFVAGRDAFAAALGSGDDWSALAEDLFGAMGALDSNAALRRALVDPSRDLTAKRGLVEALFGPRMSAATTGVLKVLVSQHWADDRDLGDAIETLAVEAVVASAEAGGNLEALEDDLFRFERLVAADSGLREALGAGGGDDNAKGALVSALLNGKSSTETIRLARQAAISPRGRRFSRVLERYLAVVATRREQLNATVTVAAPLTGVQRQRLAVALTRIYDRTVQLNVVLDPAVVGGIRVQVGDEVVDGTILRRLREAEQALMR